MQVRELAVPGAVEVSPTLHADARGTVLEMFRADVVEELTGHRFDLAQANVSVNRRGALRGLHVAEVPPGQAKYVTCLVGAVFDVVVDVRVDSPTFGVWDAVLLDDVDRRAVLVPEGFAHGFLALEDGSTVGYLCSAPYSPATEHTIDAYDDTVGITWPTTGRDGLPLEHLLSERDASAPSLKAWAQRPSRA